VWRMWIDSGGTFTDCIANGPAGVRRVKVLSSGLLRGTVLASDGGRRVTIAERWGAVDGWAEGLRLRLAQGEASVVGHWVGDGESVLELDATVSGSSGGIAELVTGMESPLVAAHLATGTKPGEPLPPIEMRLATTRGTNALLERRGGRIAVFLTQGLGDVLQIGTQQRPELFALNIVRPAPLYERVVEVPGRVGARGEVLAPIDLSAIESAVDAAVREGTRLAAVALLNSWVNPEHERRLAAFLRGRGFEHVSLSSELSPTIKLLPRAQTAVVNAYLAPVIEGYLGAVSAAIEGGEDVTSPIDASARRAGLHVMTSAGGLARAAGYSAKDSLLSGPAAGVIGAAEAARRSGFSHILTLDMGGTSTDVSRFEGGCEYVFEHVVGDARIAAPAVAVESVAAGGGSVCWAGSGGLEVGPHSAGSSPGPACYGAGGPLTVTDVNLLLGRIDPARFAVPVVEQHARARAEQLQRELAARTGERLGLEAMLASLLSIADERMAEAVRRISIRRGFAPADHVLVAFGGAGGQHACGVSERLGVDTVLIPRDVGLLSAVGLGGAMIERLAERQVLRGLAEMASDWPELIRQLEAEARSAVLREGASSGAVEVRRRLVSMRLMDQESSLAIEADAADGPSELALKFVRQYQAVYGYEPAEGSKIEVESVRIVASARQDDPVWGDETAIGMQGAERTGRLWIDGGWAEARVRDRASMAVGEPLMGPGLISEAHGTTVVASGWRAEVDRAGSIVMRRTASKIATRAAERPEVLTGRLRAIASEMGETLRRTALSTNVKERLDFSCAILDSEGELIVNAPHIPVHLGALGVCVRTVRDALPLEAGDVAVTNHPGFGGSHLPDVTVIMPVDEQGRRLGYIANRAHHAEIGGVRPGSMPPRARSLAEEGVVMPPMLAVHRGRARLEEVRRVLEGGPHPTRAVGDNMADLGAQIASARGGAAALAKLAREIGADALEGAMRMLKDRAEGMAREAVSRIGAVRLEAQERLDDGSVIRVTIEVREGRAVVDFAGSAGVHPGNFNAPAGVVRSAVMYVLRLMIDEDLPLNEGVMRAIDLRLPEGMLAPPFHADPAECPAVAAGNVETSQRVVDTLIKALGLMACGQGTMNNIIFGNSAFGYYETVGGGAGAGPGFDGQSGVHTHMTNTAITDPEVLERRFPVRVVRFALRRGSGGAGRWRGGEGVVREFEFLEPMDLSLIGQHRVEAPFGMAGGMPAARGAQRIIRADGTIEHLAGVATSRLSPGDRLVVETPGGGGYGAH
jgi:5-oxoprolinase (ATP-hydrolysing)